MRELLEDVRQSLVVERAGDLEAPELGEFAYRVGDVGWSEVRVLLDEALRTVARCTDCRVIESSNPRPRVDRDGAAAAEWGPQGVRANAVAPGVVETPLTKQIKDQPAWYDAYANKSALGRWSQPSELVGAVVYLASDASSFVTGSLMIVDGGWTAVDGRFTPPL